VGLSDHAFPPSRPGFRSLALDRAQRGRAARPASVHLFSVRPQDARGGTSVTAIHRQWARRGRRPVRVLGLCSECCGADRQTACPDRGPTQKTRYTRGRDEALLLVGRTCDRRNQYWWSPGFGSQLYPPPPPRPWLSPRQDGPFATTRRPSTRGGVGAAQRSLPEVPWQS